MNTFFVRTTQIIIRMITFLMRCMLLLLGYKAIKHEQAETDRKMRARKDLQNRLNEFIGALSHDMKTPITSIKGNIQLIGRKMRNIAVSEPEQRDDMKQFLTETRLLLERTDQQINRLVQLINRMLETSHMTSDTMNLILEMCELNVLVNEVVKDKQAFPKDRTFQTSIPEDKSIIIMADAKHIKQVLIHYLSNAHKFSAIDKPIFVQLREDGREARVEVTDQGPGIPSREHNNIWERFYRVPGTTVLSGSEVGMGLGLHISRTIIEQHKGKVGLKSKPGNGSTFWFTIPLAKQDKRAS